jgi:hypothetical protein
LEDNVKRILPIIVFVWALPAFGQTQMMCRDLKDSGGFIYQGETVINGQACRQVSYAPGQQQAVSVAAPAPVATETVATKNVNIQKDVNINANITTNAPTTATVQSPCIILSGEQHRVNGASGAVGMIAFAASKGKWQYIDAYNLPSQFVRTKYVEKDVTEMIRSGVHVIVAHSPDEVKDARISCQGQVSQR